MRRLRWWSGAAATIAAEALLYAAYQAHEARLHWFTHLFVGGTSALVVMTAVAWRSGRPVRLPGLWVVVGHLVAMFPDLLFAAGIPHHRWMDIFLAHLSSHFIPGRNGTWYLVFLAALALYLAVTARRTQGPRGQHR